MNDITETSLYNEAMELHQKILANGLIAANSIVEMCKGLKQMRDRKQYIHLGYDSFDDYSEKACGIKARQAYNYISTLENLGQEFLQSNANFGITKLKLLSDIPESKRDEILENNDISDMSTRDMKELVAELTKAQEQISFLQEDVGRKQEDTETAIEERKNLEKEVETLQKQIKSLENVLDSDLKEDIEAKNKEKIEKAVQKAKEEAEKTIKKAKEDAETDKKKAIEDTKARITEDYKQEMNKIAREKEESLLREKDLEKRLSLASGSQAIIIDHLFGDFSTITGKIFDAINKLPAEEQVKYNSALSKYLTMLIKKTEPEVKAPEAVNTIEAAQMEITEDIEDPEEPEVDEDE
jgi:chromosome segregation ATPase